MCLNIISKHICAINQGPYNLTISKIQEFSELLTFLRFPQVLRVLRNHTKHKCRGFCSVSMNETFLSSKRANTLYAKELLAGSTEPLQLIIITIIIM